MKIALDMEEVLAETHQPFIEEWNRRHGTSYTLNDVDSWDWVSTTADFDEFMDIVQNEWRKPYNIQPCEPGLAESVERIYGYVDTLDIVTARTGVEEEMQEWLEMQGIQHYDTFKSIHNGDTKAKFDYDVYIDDKPHLKDKLDDGQCQFLVHRPWNNGHHNYGNVVTVQGVSDAADTLLKFGLRGKRQ